jgi:hypothetical protein
MLNKLFVLALALTGCAFAASAYVIKRQSRREDARFLQDELARWENEGGRVVPATARPVADN